MPRPAPTTMRAAVLHGVGDLRVDEVEVPVPGDHEVLVAVSHCGVCGTDLHLVVEGWGRPGSIGGHEWSGRVAAAGDGVEGLEVGDPVVGSSPPGCGACEGCRRGRPSLCGARATPGTIPSRGAFADYVCTDAASVVAVPAGLDLRTAALAEPLAVALHAVTRSGVEPGGRVLVTGAGPIGVLVVGALRARGITDVVVSEPDPARRDLARRAGASEAVEPAALEVPTVAEPRRLVEGWFHGAIECSGDARAVEAACAQLGPAGTLVLVGTGIEAPRLDPNRILLNELVVTGAYEYDAGGVAEAVALLARGAVDVDALLQPADVDLDGLLDAMKRLADGRSAGKILVRPSPEGTP